MYLENSYKFVSAWSSKYVKKILEYGASLIDEQVHESLSEMSEDCDENGTFYLFKNKKINKLNLIFLS